MPPAAWGFASSPRGLAVLVPVCPAVASTDVRRSHLDWRKIQGKICRPSVFDLNVLVGTDIAIMVGCHRVLAFRHLPPAGCGAGNTVNRYRAVYGDGIHADQNIGGMNGNSIDNSPAASTAIAAAAMSQIFGRYRFGEPTASTRSSLVSPARCGASGHRLAGTECLPAFSRGRRPMMTVIAPNFGRRRIKEMDWRLRHRCRRLRLSTTSRRAAS